MGLRIRWTTEAVFLVAGILIILLGWISDLIGALSGETGEAHDAGSLLNRIWFTFFGLVFVAGGVVYEKHWQLLNDSVLTKRYMVSFLYIADGAFHLYALTDHRLELFPAAFFAVSAILQILVGVLLPHLPKDLDAYWVAIPAFFIAAYVLTRTLPVWPINTIEEVDAFGIISKLTEILTIVLLLSEMREVRKAAVPAKTPSAPMAGPR
jgi:hypothetical protein